MDRIPGCFNIALVDQLSIPFTGHSTPAAREVRRIIDNAPDEQTAIARAIVEYDVPLNESGGLIAHRRRE
jgi:hypothetical protein